MLHQGVDVPLLKMGTVVDHGAGQAGTEEESEGVVEGADDSESRESMDLAESEKDLEESDEDDGEKTERNNKVLQNKKPTEECTANTFVVDGKIVSIRSTVNKCILEKSSRTRKRRK
jgi:hypothetical protein